ncbi:MAG: hypothetical protein F6K47_05825 [Symploca sp. SIO2E6]|nr:hypothetical protein [Symploca sp. SIO2E6]
MSNQLDKEFEQDIITPLPGLENWESVIDTIMSLTEGNQKLNKSILLLLAQEKKPYGGSIEKWVQTIVRSRLIENWQTEPQAQPLREISRSLLENSLCDPFWLLIAYRKVLLAEKLDSNQEQAELKKISIVIGKKQQLTIANPIYANVFNVLWTNQNLGKLRPYAKKLVAWIDSEGQDRYQLLSAKQLQAAQEFLVGKKLDPRENRYLVDSILKNTEGVVIMSLEQNSEELSEFFTDFVNQVSVKADSPLVVMQEVRRWTGDQPFLSQHVCDLILVHSASFPEGQEKALVQEIVQEKIIQDWANNTASAHFQEVRQTILNDKQKDELLNLYWQIIQRGQVSVNNSQEQERLLESGLVKIENSTLKVSNAIYASIFSLEWVEKQLPDLAQPSSTTSPAGANDQTSTKKDYQTTSFTKLLSAIALAAFVIAAIADAFLLNSQDNPEPSPLPNDIAVSDRELFDNGKDHAKNGDWLDMLGEFCRLRQNSTYFDDAKSKLDQWLQLYEDDIQIALETFQAEESDSCPIVEDVFDLQ